MANHPYSTDEAWREIRSRHVGASESAALFGLSPWVTPWQIWHIKVGNLPAADLDGDAAVQQGVHFEPAVASYAQAKFGITLRKVRRYITDDTTAGMGASLDYEQIGTGSLIPTEIKWSVQWGAWDWEGDVITQAPEHYLLQCQHQMACMGAAQANLYAFVGGDLKRLTVERNEIIVGAIRQRVRAFWESIAAGQEPEPDLKADAEAINDLATIRPLAALDGDAEMERLARRRMRAQALIKKLEEMADAARSAILLRLMAEATKKSAQPNQSIVCAAGKYRITSSYVSGTEGKMVTPEMVGTRIGARGAYRALRVTEPKKKEGKSNG